ncbi:MAG TPA: hypothetical protein DGR97_07280 [Gammaproteobacteria bacterium]|nr:hypothetical protein [Gammaproteobacteria bacterium]|tara:strand:+ start:1703 stop:2074 length:372 start_codon:yes stop_codon:yes gene_type:complete
MLKKLIFFSAFFGPFILAGMLYFSMDSGADRCNKYFDQMTININQSGACEIDADCKSIKLNHPSYGCEDAIVNSRAKGTLDLMNKTVTEHGCRLHLKTATCVPSSTQEKIIRCVENQCTWFSE